MKEARCMNAAIGCGLPRDRVSGLLNCQLIVRISTMGTYDG